MAAGETVVNMVVAGVAAGIPASLTIVLVRSNLTATKDSREGWQELWQAATRQAERALEEAAKLREENGVLMAQLDDARREIRMLKARIEALDPWDGKTERRRHDRG